jgi:hypothetical protein
MPPNLQGTIVLGQAQDSIFHHQSSQHPSAVISGVEILLMCLGRFAKGDLCFWISALG